MKICKDCKFATWGGYTGSVICNHPNFGVALDTGVQKWRYAENTRLDEKLCGVEARWFEPFPHVGSKGWLARLFA